MKLKYYLRGLGIGVICTAIIMGIALSGNKKETLTDAEIIERARLLGMIMEEDSDKNDTEQNNTEKDKPSEQDSDKQEAENQKSQSNDKASEEKKEQNGSSDKKESTDESKTEKPDAASDEKEDAGNGKIIEIEIKQGEFSDVISQKLFQAGLIPDAEKFNAYMTQKGVDASLRVGVHQIPVGATVDEIIEILQEKQE